MNPDNFLVRPLCGAKGQTPLLSWAFSGRLGSSAVLADQPGDGPSMADPGGHVDHLAGFVHRWVKKAALMPAVIVEVAFILGQDCAQVPLTIDQQVIEALTVWGSKTSVKVGDLRRYCTITTACTRESALVLASFLYKSITRFAQFVVLRFRADDDKEVEILVLRHQLAVLRRQVGIRRRPVVAGLISEYHHAA